MVRKVEEIIKDRFCLMCENNLTPRSSAPMYWKKGKFHLYSQYSIDCSYESEPFLNNVLTNILPGLDIFILGAIKNIRVEALSSVRENQGIFQTEAEKYVYEAGKYTLYNKKEKKYIKYVKTKKVRTSRKSKKV